MLRERVLSGWKVRAALVRMAALLAATCATTLVSCLPLFGEAIAARLADQQPAVAALARDALVIFRRDRLGAGAKSSGAAPSAAFSSASSSAPAAHEATGGAIALERVDLLAALEARAVALLLALARVARTSDELVLCATFQRAAGLLELLGDAAASAVATHADAIVASLCGALELSAPIAVQLSVAPVRHFESRDSRALADGSGDAGEGGDAAPRSPTSAAVGSRGGGGGDDAGLGAGTPTDGDGDGDVDADDKDACGDSDGAGERVKRGAPVRVCAERRLGLHHAFATEPRTAVAARALCRRLGGIPGCASPLVDAALAIARRPHNGAAALGQAEAILIAREIVVGGTAACPSPRIVAITTRALEDIAAFDVLESSLRLRGSAGSSGSDCSADDAADPAEGAVQLQARRRSVLALVLAADFIGAAATALSSMRISLGDFVCVVCTVTFGANPAHYLTCFPYYLPYDAVLARSTSPAGSLSVGMQGRQPPPARTARRTVRAAVHRPRRARRCSKQRCFQSRQQRERHPGAPRCASSTLQPRLLG